MTRRQLSETGYYHITMRTAGQIAMFEDDDDRRRYLRLLKDARDKFEVRVIAWVLMTDHVHLVMDFGERPAEVSTLMHGLDSAYSRYFNNKTGRSGTLYQDGFRSKAIHDDAQLMATVHYVHMNPQEAGICPMREYRWSSYQEYAGKKWVVDTTTILGLFGSFEAFDAYGASQKDVVTWHGAIAQDEGVLARAIELAGVSSSAELRCLAKARRDEVVRELLAEGATMRKVARAFGIGASTVSRIARK